MARPALAARILAALAVLALAAAVVAGCGRDDEELAPPEIRYGEDMCVDCMMIISDERFAAAYLLRGARGRVETKLFDDIGDMLIHASTHPDDDVLAWYVHDYNSREWLDASAAHYVLSDAIHTPMAMGIAALVDPPSASALATESNGETLTWQALRDRYSMGTHGSAP